MPKMVPQRVVDGLSHPILRGIVVVALFTALPLLHFVAENPDYEIPVRRLLAYYLLAVIPLSFLVVWVGSGSRVNVGRVAAVVGVSFYSLGYLSVALREALGLEPIVRVDGPIWLTGVLILATVLLARWEWAQAYVLVLGLLLVASLAVQIGVGRYEEHTAIPSILGQPLDLSPRATPNIYWFVLDGYGRGDVLKEEYGFTEQDRFISELSSRELSVSSGAVAAYPLTYLSMASTLVVDYLAREEATLYDPDPYMRVIKGENRVVATLRSWGYEYVHVDNGWSGSGCSGQVDICVGTGFAGEVEWELLSVTPFTRLVDAPMSEVESKRRDPVVAVERTMSAQPNSPFFAQIHLINPHPPYFRTGKGCTFQVVAYDLTAPYGGDEYVDALRCLNRRLLESIDKIRADDEDAVIILQGDHGPAQFAIDVAPVDRWTDHDLWVRFGVLNAMALPDGCSVPDDLSLVNTFRLVFDCIAVEDVSLHPSRAWVVNTFPGAHREVTPPLSIGAR